MAPAQSELDAALAGTSWGTTEATLISNVDGQVHTSPGEWRDLLRRQLTSPVDFLNATLALPDGVRTTVEMPPSGVLTGLTKRIRDFAVQVSPATLEELQESTL
jgi:malonyl CoA-acyl carrier protein transacylase